MTIVCVNEGDTEFACVPKIAGRLGHVIIGNFNVGGCAQDWDQAFEVQILPYVRTAALKDPDKILVVVDRENRPECSPSLLRRQPVFYLKDFGAQTWSPRSRLWSRTRSLR